MSAAPAWRSRITGSGEEAPDQLLANPSNWRIHGKAQREALREVLDTVGYVAQVIVNRRTGHLVDGHLRVEEALSHGQPSIPVVYVDLSEDEERLVLASLDPLAAMATTDEAKLRELLAEVSVGSEALAAMLAALAPAEPKDGLTDPDDVPEPPDEAITQPGDLWLLGDHRLLCGDAGSEADLDRLPGAMPELRWAWPRFRHAIVRLAAKYTVIGHGHPRAMADLAPWYQRAGIEVVPDFADVCRRADLLVFDNSSVGFEFASTGRPVVVLEPYHYRRGVHHGLRFWDAVPGLVCQDRAGVPDAVSLTTVVERALEDPPEAQEAREHALELVYAHRSGAAERAAKVLVDWAKATTTTTTPEVDPASPTGAPSAHVARTATEWRPCSRRPTRDRRRRLLDGDPVRHELRRQPRRRDGATRRAAARVSAAVRPRRSAPGTGRVAARGSRRPSRHSSHRRRPRR